MLLHIRSLTPGRVIQGTLYAALHYKKSKFFDLAMNHLPANSFLQQRDLPKFFPHYPPMPQGPVRSPADWPISIAGPDRTADLPNKT